MTKARLYYEAHITVQAPLIDGTKLTDFERWAAFRRSLPGWKVSRFDVDDVDGYGGQWFASLRGADSHGVARMILTALTRLEQFNFVALRWKIEDTLLDSKAGDTEDALRQL